MDNRGEDEEERSIWIFRRKFVLQCRKISLGEPFCAAFQKISGSQKFMDKRGGGDIKVFLQKFFV